MSFSRLCLRLRRTRAFTLIELLVVILIIGILLAVALPSFLGQTQKAQNSVALQQLNTALTEAKSDWTLPSTDSSVSGFTTSAALVSYLQSSEPPSSQWAVGPDTAAIGVIDAVVGDTNTATFCTESADTIYFCAEANEESGLVSDFAASGVEVNYSYGPTEPDALSVLAHPTDPSMWLGGAGAGTNPGDGAGGTGGSSGGSAPVNSVLPVISGTTSESDVLSTTTGAWSGGPTYTYQWKDCNSSGSGCAPVASGGAASTYTLTSGDVGDTIRVVITATNGGEHASAQSAATAVVSASAPANTADTNYRGNWSSSASYAGNDSVTDGGHQWEALTAIAAEQPAPSTSPATASQYLGYGESATAEIVGPGTYSGTMNAGGGYNSLDLNNADWYAVTGAPEQQFMPLLVAVPTLTGKHSTRLATGIHRMQAVVASLSVLRLMGVE